jgi:predicted dehydrogenase
VTAAALSAGKHVFVEKPLATSTAECTALITAANRTSRILMVGHTFLYSDHVLSIERALADGQLGAIRYAHLQRLAYGRFRDDVNVIWNLGPHDVSILMQWAGRPPYAVRCIEYMFTRPHLSDVAHMALDFGDFFGHVQLSCIDPQKTRRATIAGTKAGIVYDDVAGEVQLVVNGAQNSVSISSDKARQPSGKARLPLDVELNHFATSVLTGSQPRTNGAHGAAVVAVLETAAVSAASGGAWTDIPQPSTTNPEPFASNAMRAPLHRSLLIEDHRAD